jgi:hypothetical protein
MTESLQSNEEGDTENGSSISNDIHSIHTLLDSLPSAPNEEIKTKVFNLTTEILKLQGLIMSKVNEIDSKKI